jgi:hypothetical protein
MSLLSRLFSFGERRTGPETSKSDRDSRILADYLEESSKPTALDPQFDSLLDKPLRWKIAPKGTLERLPLTAEQREQYDFVAVCEEGFPTLHLLDSRPVWMPGIPFIPSFLLVEADEGSDTMKPIGTFDSKPDNWTFAWQSGGSGQ